MILSDKSIKEKLQKGQISIDPFSSKNLQPASYDLHLDKNILEFKNCKIIDLKKPVRNLMKKKTLKKDESYILKPKQFILANVKEITGVDKGHVGRLEGKSSLARLGLIIHTTAGFLDPGNKLRLTLEIVNLNDIPIKIYEGMKIAQIAFEELNKPCENPYGAKILNSKYFGDTEVRESQMFQNF